MSYCVINLEQAMNYHFKDFIFDSEQLILYRAGDAIPFRTNEAKLLALFLRDPSQIYSKDAILDNVWYGKVVAEQAVFQNISHLRALFGEDAIKTFSKKGYQWQLPLEIKPRIFPVTTAEVINQTPTMYGGRNKWLWPAAGLLFCLTLAMGFFYLAYDQQISAPAGPTIAVLPLLLETSSSGISQDGDAQHIKRNLLEPLWLQLMQQKSFHGVDYPTKDYGDFFYAPKKYFKDISEQHSADYILVVSAGLRHEHYVIRYGLKAASNFYTAELSADTPLQLGEVLRVHLERMVQSGLLAISEEDATLINARLTLLHRQYPDDLVILQRLILNHLSLNDPHNGILLAQELQASAQLQKSDLDLAIGNLYLAKALIAQQRLPDAETELHKAASIFQREQHYRWLSETHRLFALVGFSNKNYPQIKAGLQAAIIAARQAQDPLLEAQQNDELSIIANKFQQESDKVYFLNQAEAVLDKSRQSLEHYAIIYFHRAMYSHDPQVSEHLYRRILQILPAGQGWWEYDRAQAHLVDLLIQQKRWQEAVAIFPSAETITSSQGLMLGKIYAAQGEWQEAESQVLKVFKEASLAGGKSLALDAALLLLTFYDQQGKYDQQILYKKFITVEAAAVPHWIMFNKDALARLNIVLKDGGDK